MFHTKETIIRPNWRIVLPGVLIGLLAVGGAVALAGPGDDAYEAQLDDLQQRINAAQSGEPVVLTDREAELEGQLAEMEERAVKAETSLAECTTALAVAKERR